MQEVVDLTRTESDGDLGTPCGERAARGARPASAAAALAAARPPAAARQKGGRKRSTAEAVGSGGSSASRRQRKEAGAGASPPGHKQAGKRGGEKRTDPFGRTVSWRPKASKQVQERIAVRTGQRAGRG